MRFLLRLPVVRLLHQRQLLFPVAVLLIVAVVLTLGAIEQRDAVQAVQQPSLTEDVQADPPFQILRAELEKTPLTYFSDYWSQLAKGARQSLTKVGPSQTPAVMVGPRLALTTAQVAVEVIEKKTRKAFTMEEVADGGDPRIATEESRSYKLRGWDDEVGLALFDVAGEASAAFKLTDPRGLSSGSYLGAITIDSDGQTVVIPGSLVSTTTVMTSADEGDQSDLVVSMNLPSTLEVAAIVNLDGALVGLAYGSANGVRVVSSTRILRFIDELQTDTICRAIEVTDLDEGVRSFLALTEGVLVEYVHESSFEPEPSLQAGDVLLEWAGERVQSAEQFWELYDAQDAGMLVRYRVLRSRRRVFGGTRMPDADCDPIQPNPVRLTQLGLALQWMARAEEGLNIGMGWQVVAVTPDGPSATAGVEERDWLVAVNGTAVDDQDDRDDLEFVANRKQPLLLSLLRDDRMKLVAVTPFSQ